VSGRDEQAEDAEGISGSGEPSRVAVPGRNCWRVARAERAAFLVDAERCFSALRQAVLAARRSILIAGWDVDSRTVLPRGAEPEDDLPERLEACLDDARTREVAQVALEELVMGVPPTLQRHAPSLGFAFGEHAGLCPREGADGRLAALLIRRGRLEVGPGRADLHLPADAIDIAVRRAGLDIDPGWVPWLGRVIRFHYDLP